MIKSRHNKNVHSLDFFRLKSPSKNSRPISPLSLNFTSRPSTVRDLAGNAFKTVTQLMSDRESRSAQRSTSSMQVLRSESQPEQPVTAEPRVHSAMGNRDIKTMSLQSKVKMLKDMGFTSLLNTGGKLVDFESKRDDMPKSKISTADLWSTTKLNIFLKKYDLIPAFKILKRRITFENVRAASHQSLPSKPYIMDINTKRRTIKSDANYYKTPDTLDTFALQRVTEPLTGGKQTSKELKLHKIMKDCDDLYHKTRQLNSAFEAMTSRQGPRPFEVKKPGPLTKQELIRIQNLMKSLA